MFALALDHARLVRELTARNESDSSLAHRQKMESLGEMAGAVAHDFNNLLTTILGVTGLLKLSPTMPATDRESLSLVEIAARRAADLTSRLLAFARGGAVRFEVIDLRDVVTDTSRLASPSLKGRIKLELTVPEQPLLVEGDLGQIQQALLNIVLNARDALVGGGQIRLSLALESDPMGDHAVVTIADDGPGIPEHVRARIFEPFFTTKPKGAGTGLGMAIAYGVVRGHGGSIDLDTEVGRGTTFRLRFPRFLYDAGALEGLDEPVTGTGSERRDLILVVDDDDLVRRTTMSTLGSLGYAAVAADSGPVAIQLVTTRPERFAGVVLDLVMPGMPGNEVFRALLALRPDLPVVVCTGYAPETYLDNEMRRRVVAIVQKPFSADQLAEALAEAGLTPRVQRPHHFVA
jgi:two-component system, cell cycle sensor histidine kinase and response regulator CckA